MRRRLGDTAAILGPSLLGLPIPVTWTPGRGEIVLELRLPRVLTAMLVGGGLAMAGDVFQALLRNPLADPYVIGTAAGAILGAVAGHLPPALVPALALGAGTRAGWGIGAGAGCSPSPADSAPCCWSTRSRAAAAACRS